MGEHSPCDALIPSIVADYMLAEGCGKPKGVPAPAKKDSEEGKRLLAVAENEIRRLEWVTDQSVIESIEAAEKEVDAIVEDSEGLMLWFEDYGTEWIKKQGEGFGVLWADVLGD